MKKTFTLLIAALLCCVGVVKADVTDLPRISTVENPIYYTIVNTRSSQPGGLMYWAGDNVGMKDEQAIVLENKHKFFFTGSHDAMYVHNAATGKKLATIGNGNNAAGSWTDEGTEWAVGVSPKGGGLAFGPKGGLNGNACWNECNYETQADKPDFTTWSANDDGSIFIVDLAEDYVFPKTDLFYVIESPLFEKVQGVKKAIYVNAEGKAVWGTEDLTNHNFYWIPTVDAEGKTVALKNLGTGTYLSKADGTMTTEAATATLKILGDCSFNINIGGTIHANNHDNGNGDGSNLVSWGGAAGSASAWKFVEKGDPATLQEVVVRYSFTADGEEQLTQETTTFVGEEWPTFELPYGVSATKLEGVIDAKEVVDGKVDKEIELTITLPFEAAASVESISTWYYLQMHSNDKKYIEYLNGESYLAWEDSDVDMNDADKYVWAFVGNVFDGFKLVNKAATTAMAVKSTGSGDATMDTYANGTAFVLAATSTGAEGGFCLRYPDNNQYLNAQNGKVAHWSATDAGSTIFATDISAYISSVKEEALATLAQYAASPLVFDQNLVSKAIETVKALSETETSTVNKANAEVAAVKEDAESRTYTFQTKATDNHRNGVWVSANTTTEKAIGAHSFDNNAIWSLKIENANTFYIYNRLNKTYIGAPSSNCPLTADPTTAYSLEVVNGTLVELKHNGETLHASNHNDDKLLNYDGNEDASRWYMGFYAMDYEVDVLLTGNAWMIKPSLYLTGSPNAENAIHIINDQLTIYTSRCHWSNELILSDKKSSFHSNELPYAIKSIRFDANCDNEESLIIYGSNDGEDWTLVNEVLVPCTGEDGIADFTGTAYNYFMVKAKGTNKVSIEKFIIELDPTVELPLIVATPSFNLGSGSMYETSYLKLSAEEGTTIWWSTDGENYEEYTREIKIDTTCTIYAYASMDGVDSEVASKTYKVAAAYENIGAMLAAVEATEEGTPVIINLHAAITKLGQKQATINDNTGELLLSDNNLPDYYALKDTLGGKLRGEYKLVKGVATMCNLDKAYLTYIKFVPSEAPALAGQYFTVGKPAVALNTNTWYVLKNVNRKAYVNEADNSLKMVDPANYTSRMAADEHQGVLFHLVQSKNDSQYYNIVSGKGHYFSLGHNTATVSTTAVDFIVDKISGNTYYMQDQSTTYVADGQNAGQNFVGWGSTIPTSTTGNNAYQFLEVEFIDGSKLESQAKAASLHYELQQAYGLVASASQFSSNAVEPTEGSLANLLDNDYNTFFHSTWSAAVEDTHYLQAEVSQPAKSFFFYFKKRSQNNANRPTNITILGSNDGTEFTEITTIKSGLPTDAAVKDYTSSVINAATAYKHIRFVVNATNNGAKEANGNQFFTFSEFYIFPNNSTIVNALNAANALLAVDIDNQNFEKLQAAFEAAYEKVNATKYKVQFDEAIAEANALLTAAKHAEKPALGEYSTAAYNTFKSTIAELKKATPSENSINAIREAIKAFTKAKCLPVFTIDGVISYAAGKSIYEAADGQLYFKTTDENDTTMLWTFDMTVKKVGVTEAVTVRNMATGNLFWGSQSIRVTETSDANEEDEIFLFYTENNNIPVHAQNDFSKIVRWASTESTSGSAWVFTYVGTTYDLDDLFEDDSDDPEVDPEDPEVDPEDPEVDPEDPEDNPETGINSAENCDKPIVVYTITGKAIQTTVGKLQNLEKGIYIIDGKKKMVK